MKTKIVIAYLTVCLTWGLTWLVIRMGLADIPPFYSGTFRFAVAVLVLWGIVIARKIPVPLDKKSILLYLFMGICSFLIPFGLIYWSEQYVSSGLSSVLFAVYPFSVAILSSLTIPEERTNAWQISGMVVSFLGIISIFAPSISFNLNLQFVGMLAVIGSALMQSIVVIIVKKHGRQLHPVTINFFPMLIGGVCFAVAALLTEDFRAVHFTWNSVFSFIFLGIFGSVLAFTAYYWLLKKISIFMLSLTTFITPIVALIAGAIVLHEILKMNEILGSILVIAGLILSNGQHLRKLVIGKAKDS
ncbi:MAG: DMT family transporter [Ignavibacteria bacterium]|nr:DMT family transporter [Ignavibacteria bacterium]